MKSLLFAYPIPEYIDHCIARADFLLHTRLATYLRKREGLSEDELERQADQNTPYIQAMRKEYRARSRGILRQFFYGTMNRAIYERYRRQGYHVHWVMFAKHDFSPLMTIQSSDIIIETELTFANHTTRREDGTYPYADTDNIIRHLKPGSEVVVTGYHAHDCVDKIAEAAHKAGFQTTVDEELTELFLPIAKAPTFRVDRYPSVTPKYITGKGEYDSLSRSFRAYEQQKRPWLYQWPITEPPQNPRTRE